MSVTTVKKATKRSVKADRANIRFSAGVLALVILFCIYSLALVFQRNMINNLDADIRSLTAEYNEAVKINDDLEGQLLKASNINEVEKYAAEVLGMVKPGSDSVTYVSYGSGGQQLDADASAPQGGTLAAWLNGLFN